MAKVSHRFFALFFAILFLVTSSSLAIVFILANVESNSSGSSTANSNCPQQTAGSQTSLDEVGHQLPDYTPVAAVSQLKITNLATGQGPAVKPDAVIAATYTGALATSGVIFQTSSTPVCFSLDGGVIPGWEEGIPGMKVGGSRQLLIPASLAYGAKPPAGSGIPANTPLVFDVTLKQIISN